MAEEILTQPMFGKIPKEYGVHHKDLNGEKQFD
jgi:hypothetical protein